VTGKARSALAAELARPLLDSWWTVVAGVCLGLAAGMLGYRHVPKEYRATVTIAVEADGGSVAELHAAATDHEVLRRLVARARLSAGSTTTPEVQLNRLKRRVSVAALPEDGVVALTVSAGEADDAARVANTLGDVISGAGTPYTVAARATTPPRPVAPRPIEVYTLGVIIGLIIFAGFPLVRSGVNPVICNAATIRGMGDLRRRRLVNVLLSVISVVGLAGAALAVAFL
jgi:LPS O-antigen subunit length determinant protein (WzzB/FepE family)